jgi:dTDP-4-amino-4,6-dideoxygalactose transaminase
LRAVERCNKANIFPRRYFYPALNNVSTIDEENLECSISQRLSQKMLCLPLSSAMSEQDIERVLESLLDADKK